MKLNEENLSKQDQNGRRPAIEIARACGVDVGKPSSTKYSNWEVLFDGRQHVRVFRKRHSSREIHIFLYNGDVSVYDTYSSGFEELVQLDNIRIISEIYTYYNFELNKDKDKDFEFLYSFNDDPLFVGLRNIATGQRCNNIPRLVELGLIEKQHKFVYCLTTRGLNLILGNVDKL